MTRTGKVVALLFSLMVLLLFPAVMAGEDAMTVTEETPAAETTERPEAVPTLAPVKPGEMPNINPDAAAEAIVTEPAGTMMFQLPAHESPVLQSLPAGSVLTLKRLGLSWSRVKSGELEGFVPTLALSFSYGSPQPVIALVTAPGGKLTLREEMSTRSGALGTVPSGRAVLLIAKSEPFSLIRHDGREGYALSAYLREATAEQGLGTLTGVVSVDPSREANVRLRAQPSRSGTAWTTVRSGEQVVVLEARDGWARVEYEGFHGWMMEEYLNLPR